MVQLTRLYEWLMGPSSGLMWPSNRLMGSAKG